MIVREDIYYTYACQSCNEKETETPVATVPHEKNIIPGSFARQKPLHIS
jgi:transposase